MAEKAHPKLMTRFKYEPPEVPVERGKISLHLARRLRAEAGADAAGQVDHLFWLALGRPPEPDEAEACLQFLERKRANYESRGEAKNEAKNDATHVALRDLCLAVINTNEFLYLD